MLRSAMIKPVLVGVIKFGSVIKETQDSIGSITDSIGSITQLGRFFHNLFKPKKTFIISEFNNFGRRDILYYYAQLYLSSNSKRLSDAPVVHLSMTSLHPPPVESIPDSYSVNDSKDGFTVTWTSMDGSSHNQQGGSWGGSNRQRSLSLTYNPKDHLWVRDVYLKYVIEEAKKVISNSHPFSHLDAFDTLELEQILRDWNPGYLQQFDCLFEHIMDICLDPSLGRLLLSNPRSQTILVRGLAKVCNIRGCDFELRTVRTKSELCQLLVSSNPMLGLVVKNLDGSFELVVTKICPSFNINKDYRLDGVTYFSVFLLELNNYLSSYRLEPLPRSGRIKPVLGISGDDAEISQAISPVRRSKRRKCKPDGAKLSPGPRRYSCQSQTVQLDPLDNLQAIASCKLTVAFGDETRVCAFGRVYPMDDTIHGVPVKPNHMKVSIDNVVDTYGMLPLPVAQGEHDVLSSAFETFIQWPKKAIVLDERTPQPSPVQQVSTPGLPTLRDPLVPSKLLKKLEKDFHELHEMILVEPEDNFPMTLPAGLVSDEDVLFTVAFTDIRDLMNFDQLDISILQVFILYLAKQLESRSLAKLVGFMDPSICSDIFLKNNSDYAANYMSARMSLLQDGKFILLPYFQAYHWILLVICPRDSRVYVIDSAMGEFAREGRFKEAYVITSHFEKAYQQYKEGGGTHQEESCVWELIECPRQPDGKVCGFYVMKHMLDLISEFDINNFPQDVKFPLKHYTPTELHKLRVSWCKYMLWHLKRNANN